ncbi:hypothetical protein L9F63_005635, partial [Diploptera punctata]
QRKQARKSERFPLSYISKGIPAIQWQHKKVKRYNAENVISRIFMTILDIKSFRLRQ